MWREDATWYQAIGSGVRGVGGTVLLYRSKDLVHWEYMHPIVTGDRLETGDMWECPDLFRLGPTQVLMVSPIPLRKTLYFLGSFDEHRFQPSHRGVVDDGGYFYAPQSFTDTRARRIMFGWLSEGRDQEAQVAAGWAGVMSLPRVLQLGSDGQLGIQAVPELESLRGPHVRVSQAHGSGRLDIEGSTLEIIAEFAPSRADRFGLKVCCSPDGREQTLIGYESASAWLSIDRERSSLDAAVHREPRGTRITLADDQGLQLHVFVDHSVVEVYANRKACLTTRIYPSRSDSVGVEVFAEGGAAELQQLDAWKLSSIWP